MKRPFLLVLLCTGFTLTACSPPPVSQAPQAQEVQAVELEDQSGPETITITSTPSAADSRWIPEVEVPNLWGNWTPPEVKPLDSYRPYKELFDPCTEIPDYVAKAMGIEIIDNGEIISGINLCTFNVLGRPQQAEAFTMTTVPWVVESEKFPQGVAYDDELPYFPELKIVYPEQVDDKRMCKAMLTTYKGLIIFNHLDTGAGVLGDDGCEVPATLLAKLYKKAPA